jgi:hypothetical protein
MRKFASCLALIVVAAGPVSAATPHRTTVHKVIVKKVVAADGSTRMVGADDPAAKALIAGCGERRFETQAEVDDASGHKRVTKIKLCAKPGEDDAAWLNSLRSARAQVAQLTQLPPASRTKLAADLDAEIARVGAAHGSTTTAPTPAPIDPALIAGPPK